jgi:hypothetical protein
MQTICSVETDKPIFLKKRSLKKFKTRYILRNYHFRMNFLKVSLYLNFCMWVYIWIHSLTEFSEGHGAPLS